MFRMLKVSIQRSRHLYYQLLEFPHMSLHDIILTRMYYYKLIITIPNILGNF